MLKEKKLYANQGREKKSYPFNNLNKLQGKKYSYYNLATFLRGSQRLILSLFWYIHARNLYSKNKRLRNHSDRWIRSLCDFQRPIRTERNCQSSFIWFIFRPTSSPTNLYTNQSSLFHQWLVEWNYLTRWSPFEASWTNGCLCSRSTAILDCADACEHREIRGLRTLNIDWNSNWLKHLLEAG